MEADWGLAGTLGVPLPRISRSSHVVLAVVVGLLLIGCGKVSDGEAGSPSGEYDPTPRKLDGSESYEFEHDDIEQAEGASPEVQKYCEGAVSEAQRLGCLSHVEEVP